MRFIIWRMKLYALPNQTSSYALSQRKKKYTIHIGAYATEVKRETNSYAVRQKWKRRENGER